MKFSIELKQRHFFRENNAIEFERIFSEQDLYGMNTSIKEIFYKAKATDFFLEGHDLFRRSEAVKKAITSSRLCSLIYELLEQKPLRLGFDQLFPPIKTSYLDYYPEKLPFSELSAVKNLHCLLFINLSGEGKPPVFEEGDPFPSKPGNTVLLLPKYAIDFNKLSERMNQTFLLVGYTLNFSQYLFVEKDPHCHQLKRLGYVFGDKLRDNEHPIILR